MLSKCANPACRAQFRYLHAGKLFVARYRNSATSNGRASAPDFNPIKEQWRCFWLCSDCSRNMTVEAGSTGGVRIAGLPKKRSEGDQVGSTNPHVVMLAANQEPECPMRNPERKLDALIKELEFLKSGGYRIGLGWRPPLVFEDSPICPKTPFSVCPDPRCVLTSFVPMEHQSQSIPCRYIRLNQAGESLQSLYRTATMAEIENTLREWLEREIMELKKSVEEPATLPTDAAA